KASRIVKLCSDAGVKLTPAGAPYPYKKDPGDSNIRIAPTFPSYDDMKKAAEIFCTCAKLSALEQLTEEA
ncbi:MAG: aminotransferase, partial [Clostridia bacterium]|nr:aminotransferase [Clostridia bacterium]